MPEIQQVRDDTFQDRMAGVLLGTAVGDSIGLPAEGLSRHRRQRLLPGPWRHRFLCGHGMISDDTEHTLMVAQSLLTHPDDAVAFGRDLARRLRWWFLGLPAGVGLATARACTKLWLGFSPKRSGVQDVNGRSFPADMLQAARASRSYHNARLKQFCQDLDIPLAVTSGCLGDGHFSDACHPNVEGAKIIAGIVFDVLIRCAR